MSDVFKGLVDHPPVAPDAGGSVAVPFRFEGMPRVVGSSRRVVGQSRDTATPAGNAVQYADPLDMHYWPENQ